MPLAAGSRVGPYEITGALGAGGMGEVYRARDTKLNRDVALKVLPATYAADPERLARFAREAQLLASLNHTNIAHLFGVVDDAPSGASGALIMEFVDGPTLADRLQGGPLPLEDALPIARQIADALDTAHAQGVVHRDLKPANVKVRDDGTVKVLDFGLAKLVSPGGAPSDTVLANSPTLTAPPTELGMILGTASYMAPEQAKGRTVDKGADIWAFGVVLYEMLTGRQMFQGDSTSEIVANVLKEPPDWTALPPRTPAAVRRLLVRCVEKDPKRRLRDIGDARLELEDATVPAAARTARSSGRIPSLVAAAVTGAAVTAAALLLTGPKLQGPARAELQRVSILPPPGQRLYPDAAESAISPDGRHLAFRTGTRGQHTQLWVRSLASATPRLLPGTLEPSQPFWSPDGTRIGFFDDRKMKTIALDSGAITVICDAPDGRGAAWSRAGVIVFAPSNAGALMKVSAEGGDPQPVTALDPSRSETAHRFPYFLPDGRHFVFAALSTRERLDIIAGSVDGPERRLITTATSGAVYADPGYLLFTRQNGLAAQQFDAEKLETAGEPVTLPDQPADVGGEWLGGRPVSVSSTGVMTYMGGSARSSKLIWLELATGKEAGGVEAAGGFYDQIAIAPDAKHAAITRTESAVEADIYIVDLERGGTTRLTNGPAANRNPLWSPDSTRVAYGSDRGGSTEFFVRSIAGGAEELLLKSSGLFQALELWAPDGRSIVYSQLDPETQRDLWILPLTGERVATPYLRTAASEFWARISPDGRWLSYMSRENGANDLYVQPYPGGGQPYRVTSGGVSFGRFVSSGGIVYAVPGDPRLYLVDVYPGPPFRTGPPRIVGALPADLIAADSLPDLSKLLVSVPTERNAVVPLTMVTNWTEALRRK